MGQAAATGYVPDKGLPGGYQPEVEECPPAMMSSKVTTDARLSDDDGLWAGESKSALNSSMATEPWRHASRSQYSADPPRFDSAYNQAPCVADWMDDAGPPQRSGLHGAAGGSFVEGSCMRQSSIDHSGGMPREHAVYSHSSMGEPPGQSRLDLEPSRPGPGASWNGTRCSSYASEFDAAPLPGPPAPPHLGGGAPPRSQLDAPRVAPSRCHSHMSAAGSDVFGAGGTPAAPSHQPGTPSAKGSYAQLEEHRPASAAPYMGASAHLRIGTTMPPPGAAVARNTQSAREAEEALVREAWAEGSMVEMFSSTSACWHVARLVEVRQEGCQAVLTARFYMEDEPKQKSLYRHDAHLAPLGTHTGGELPPGFTVKSSQSRPGQLVYLDATTGTKYGSAELAWCVHFDRLMQQPAAGLQTVCAIPKQRASNPGASPALGRAAASPAGAAASGGSPAGSGPISVAELRARGPGVRSPPRGPSVLTAAEETLSAAGGSKVALPAFSGASDSQSAYLGYVGALGLKHALATPASDRPQQAWRPPRANFSPTARAWHEDAFSQWRGQ